MNKAIVKAQTPPHQYLEYQRTTINIKPITLVLHILVNRLLEGDFNMTVAQNQPDPVVQQVKIKLLLMKVSQIKKIVFF